MTAASKVDPRRLLPRWRPWRIALDMQELMPARTMPNPEVFRPAFDSAEHSWSRSPTDTRGSELVLAALSFDPNDKQALGAADQMLESKNGSQIAREFARRFIELPASSESTGFIPGTVSVVAPEAGSAALIRQLRKRTHAWPRNALTWVDLARAYFVLGEDEKAQRSLEVALALDPDNRFVVRSSVRFYVHVSEEKRAAALVSRASGSSEDPWLQSVVVALGREARRPSLRHSVKLLEDRSLAPWHIGELGAALATSEFEHGQSRRARGFMKQALIDPTENALAHAEWATTLGLVATPDHALPRAPYEAMARKHARLCEWAEAAQWARWWLDDEPFSGDAATLGSWYATESEDFESAVEMTTIGLTANPGNPTLLNNRAFALACTWKLDEAAKAVLDVDMSKADLASVGCLFATAGFIAYRVGEVEQARELYQRAIRHFSLLREPELCARAAVNLAAEDLRTRSPHLETSMRHAATYVRSSKSLEVESLWQRVQDAKGLSESEPLGWKVPALVTAAVAVFSARMDEAEGFGSGPLELSPPKDET